VRNTHVYDQFVYYINFRSGGSLEKFDPSIASSHPSAVLLAGEGVGSFSILGEDLYYAQHDFASSEEKIYKTDLEGNDPVFVVDGDAPIVIGDYLFYQNAGRELMHVLR
jgi:hypothetical protein